MTAPFVVRRLRHLAIGVAAAGTIAFVSGSSPASAQTVAIHISGTGGDGVRLRSAPNASGATVAVIPEGAAPPIECATTGQNVGGVAVWMKARWNNQTGFYASYYDDAHYSSYADLSNRYGIPQCGTGPTTPTTTAAQQSAMNWARARTGSYAYRNLCLSFVFDAYGQAGVNLRSQVRSAIGSDTYPVDIWGKFSQGQTGVGTPPPGALVFYASRTGDRTLSHVVLSLGGGNTVSTSDGVATTVHYETLAQHSYANYLGWWLPAS